MTTRLVRRNSSRRVFRCWCYGLLFVVVSFGAGATTRTAIAQQSQLRSLDRQHTTHLRHPRRRPRRTNNTNTTTTLQEEEGTARQLIVGGRRAIRSEYPQSMVFLSDRLDNLSCGGTLISPTIVYVICYSIECSSSCIIVCGKIQSTVFFFFF